MQFEEWYKQWIEGNAEAPPDNVWEEIQNTLDIDQVWHQVSDGLDEATKKRKPLYWAVAASFLLLVASAGLITFFSGTFQPTHVADVQPVPHRPAPHDMPSILGRETALPTKVACLPSLSLRERYSVQIQRTEYPVFVERVPASLPYITALACQPFPGPTPILNVKISTPQLVEISAKEQTSDILAFAEESEKTHQPYYFAGLSLQLANT